MDRTESKCPRFRGLKDIQGHYCIMCAALHGPRALDFPRQDWRDSCYGQWCADRPDHCPNKATIEQELEDHVKKYWR